MFKRIVIIFLACSVAGVVLFLTLLADPSDSKRGERSVVEIDPSIPWTLPAHNQAGSGAFTAGTPGSRVRARKVNDRGQIFEFSGDELEPLTEAMSMIRLTNPMVRIHLKPGERVLEVRAKEGTFIAPDLQPRSGDFHGDVIVTLFEAEPGERLSLEPDSPNVVVRIFLAEASFDLEAGSVEGDGDVLVTSAGFEFRGKGLRLTYNEVRRRLQELLVNKGTDLRLSPKAAQRRRRTREKQAGESTAKKQPQVDPELQYYRATFHDNVTVQSESGKISNCDTLEVNFAARRQSKDENLMQQLRSNKKQSSRAAPGGGAFAATPMLQVLMSVIAQPQRDPRSLFTPNDDDVVIRWAGKLQVRPIEKKPTMFVGANDFSFKLRGKPMRITTVKQDLIIHSPLMEYFHEAARLRLAGAKQHPLTFDAEQWGVLRSNELVVDVAEQRAVFYGQGNWKAHGERDVIAELEPGHFVGRYDRLPPGSAMAWHDKLVVSFYMDDQSKRDNIGDIKAIKRARFHGDVNIYHPEFDLRGDTLTAGLDPPDETTQRQRITDLSATGNIHILSHADKPEDQLNLRSNELIIGLENLENGKMRPTGVLARGNVNARQRDLSLVASELLVELDTGEQEFSLKPTKRSESTSKIDYKRVIASDNVRVEIELSDDTVEIGAAKLIVEGDQIEFFGEDPTPATMSTSKGMLMAKHFVLDQAKETLHTIGAGTFDIFATVLDEKTDPRFADRELLLTTTWRDNMHYDNLNNYVQFIGNVLSRSKRGHSTMQLRADDLRLDIATNEAGDTPTDDRSLLARGDRELKRIAAHGSAQFIAANWGRFGGDKPDSRITIEGPAISFEGESQLVQVMDKGRMGIEDYREKSASEVAAGSPIAQVSGRGATLFTWADQLNLDFKHNDMMVLGQAQMLHVPLGKNMSQGVQVDCRRLIADLMETGGLQVLQRDKPDQVDLRQVIADGDVRVIGYDHEIYTDHLDYTHFDQTMMLEGEAGNDTRVIKTSSGTTSLSGRKIKWDLQRNRFEMINMGRGTIPLQRR